MSNIKFVSNDFIKDLSLFQDEINKMNALFNSVSSTTSGVGSYWTGNSSDCALKEISDFIKTFDDVREKNKKYIDFLTTTMARYKAIDNNISKAVDVGAAGLSINGSDK